MPFITTIKNNCLQQKLFSRGDRILIGVSGGPDSVALLYVLFAIRHGLGLQLSIAHLNHGLRKEATAEQSYVKELAKKLGLPLFTKTIKLQKTKTYVAARLSAGCSPGVLPKMWVFPALVSWLIFFFTIQCFGMQ